ncbi:MAG: 5-formyltetrahydrofolate cyclo-ligase [Clostridia bacterium]|nr:5-formyltetrahydrofolate cyclo-ligase [Clostridia bacterium]
MGKAEEKRALRQRVRRSLIGEALRVRESQAICERLMAWPVYQNADTVAAFVPLPWEADVKLLLADALWQGKRLLLPRVAEGEMHFHIVSSLEELKPGTFGIPEPEADAPSVSAAEAQLILVPLDAADRQGFRLGKGGGYYDRLLAECPALVTCAAVLSSQWVEQVPADPWDLPVSWLCDARGLNPAKDGEQVTPGSHR